MLKNGDAEDRYVKRWWQMNRHRATTYIEIGDMRIQVNPLVFNPDPKVTWSTQMMLDTLPNTFGKRVLDIGTGTGVLGLACAKQGAEHVLGIDTLPFAIRNACENAQILGLERNTSFSESNLFSNIDHYKESKCFDVVLANLPILPMDTSNRTIQLRLIERIPDFLSENGIVLFTYASFGGQRSKIEAACRFSKLKWERRYAIQFGVHWDLFIGKKVSATSAEQALKQNSDFPGNVRNILAQSVFHGSDLKAANE